MVFDLERLPLDESAYALLYDIGLVSQGLMRDYIKRQNSNSNPIRKPADAAHKQKIENQTQSGTFYSSSYKFERPVFSTDSKKEFKPCSKKFMNFQGKTACLLTRCLIHGVGLGGHSIEKGESTNDIISHLLCHWNEPPLVAVGDYNCAVHNGITQRLMF